MSRAFIFPGQGSQAVGMGKDLGVAYASAREVFQEVDDALGQKLSKLMWEGSQEDLTLTENAQPAIMAVSLAVVCTLEKEGGFKLADKAAFVAGHSLGEYSALAAAGAFTLADTARLLKLRGQAMQRAVPVGQGALAVLLGLDFDAASEIAKEAAQGEVCEAANDNGGGQVVVSGHKAAVERAIEIAKGKGAKRSMAIPVSAPFHCALMKPAADEMAEALAGVDLKTPSVALVANVTASRVADPATIRDLLVKQVTGMVRWRESVLYMEQHGVSKYIEVGAGKALAGMVKRIVQEGETVSVGAPADVEALLKTL
ncbi:MAG: ACP S-malonyltransferase [Parvibaculum sp.]|uniref:ACP S-malonyltransferase n=1 Tax=Parvibaculum sp. TaxID=2024848 RepID=UPI002848B94E|nr:ACP S-malonyltransferase [Parvibaculum sp.]MDR3498564.1 ACP S-malonyltransferase [Parvibaculum sp.]